MALLGDTIITRGEGKVTTDPNNFLGNVAASFAEQLASASGAPPRSVKKPKAARRKAPRREPVNTPSAGGNARSQMVTLEGIFDGKNLGDYSLSYAAGQLMVSSPHNGGAFNVDPLPFGEWFALADERGVSLPVAVQRTRMDAYCVRVDPAPLQGLRTLISYPGWVPSGTSANTPQQQRQNDQMAIRALQTGSSAEHQAAMNTARHFGA